MSDKDVRKVQEEAAEQEMHAHQFAMKGQSEDVGLIAKTHDQSEHNPHSEKAHRQKRLKDDFTRAVMQGYLESYHRVMSQFRQELEALRQLKEQLENNMQDNRLAVDENAMMLNEIDDLFMDFKKGGVLDYSKVELILADKNLNNLSDTQIITLLEDKRIATLQANENLDDAYELLQHDHQLVTDCIQVVKNGMEKLEAISANPNMSEEQKNAAIQNIEADIGTSALHDIASQSNDGQAVDMTDTIYREQKNHLQNNEVMKPF